LSNGRNSGETVKTGSAENQLAGFIAKYSPEIGAAAHEVLAKMRELTPGAVEMVYDNYNALVIGFGPTERASEAVFSIVLYPRWVTLCFLQGAKLRDPDRVLKGKGSVARHIVLEDTMDLEKPEIESLISAALKCAAKPLDGANTRRLIIKSVSAKQRPRRPGS
jgi:hypothetical protein